MHDKVMGGQPHTAGPWEVIRVDDVLAIMPDPVTGRADTFLGIAIIQEHDGERSARRVEANARLISAAPDLLEALDELQDVFAHDGEGSLERFERLAEMFRKDTGYLAPGKDPGMCSSQPDGEELRAIYDAWFAAKVARARAAIAKATGESAA